MRNMNRLSSCSSCMNECGVPLASCSISLQRERRKDKQKQKKRKENDLPGVIAAQTK